MTPWRWKPIWIMPEDVFRVVLEGLDPDQAWSSASICRELGQYLAEQATVPGSCASAYLKRVPVFIAAFTDSELGLDLAGFMVQQALAEGKDIGEALGSVSLNLTPSWTWALTPERPWPPRSWASLRWAASPALAPNWAQQVAPYLDLLHTRLNLDLPEVRFHYRSAALPGTGPLGGLSGCTFKEGLLGQVCLFGGRRPLCRGAVRRRHRPGLSYSRASASVLTKRQWPNHNPARALRMARNSGLQYRRPALQKSAPPTAPA